MDYKMQVYENVKLIAKNSAEIGMLMRLFYIIVAGIFTNILMTATKLFQGMRNGKK